MANPGGQQPQTSTTTAFAAAANNNNNLLSVQAAEQVAGQQRRKSTLSANGFFIDYSCTRRRSSAAIQQSRQQADWEAALGRNQFLRTCISPVRRPSAMVTGSGRLLTGTGSGPSSPARAHSRASYSAATTSAGSSLLLAPPVGSLLGSRKTSIFDPTGHSLLAAAVRRKSTLAPTNSPSAGPQPAAAAGLLAPSGEQAATMLAVARSAAALQRGVSKAGKGELVQRVPVIGCSPTSIQASLAALEESRRYEKLLRKLRHHQKRKGRRRLGAEMGPRLGSAPSGESASDDGDGDDHDRDDHDDDDDENESGSDDLGHDAEIDPRRRSLGLRRKSLRAIKDAASVLRSSNQRRRRRRPPGHESLVDGLSISSTLSFASSRTSLPSMERFFDDYELTLYRHQADSDPADEDDCEGPQDRGGGPARNGHEPEPADRNRSLVRRAMRKLAATISRGQPSGETSQPPAPGRQQGPRAKRRSISVAAGLNYWHYYFYLRDQSLEPIDDLPVSSNGPMSEAERRARLYVNYSLARLEILNSSSDPVAKLADRLAQAASASSQPAGRPQQLQQQVAPDEAGQRAAEEDQAESPVWRHLFDFSQSTDVSLTLSTSSSSLTSSSTSRNSLSLSSPASTVSSPAASSTTRSDDQPCTSPTCISQASSLSLAARSTLSGSRGRLASSRFPVQSVQPAAPSHSISSLSIGHRAKSPSRDLTSASRCNLAPPTTTPLGGQPPKSHSDEQVRHWNSNQLLACSSRQIEAAEGRELAPTNEQLAPRPSPGRPTAERQTNEEELDDFERFNRCYKPQAADHLRGRDSHFRSSVKSARSPQRDRGPPGPALEPAPWERLGSRTFRSWDRLDWTETSLEGPHQRSVQPTGPWQAGGDPVWGPATAEAPGGLPPAQVGPEGAPDVRFPGGHPTSRRSFRQPKSSVSSLAMATWRPQPPPRPHQHQNPLPPQPADVCGPQAPDAHLSASNYIQRAAGPNDNDSLDELDRPRVGRTELVSQFEAQMNEAASLAAGSYCQYCDGYNQKPQVGHHQQDQHPHSHHHHHQVRSSPSADSPTLSWSRQQHHQQQPKLGPASRRCTSASLRVPKWRREQQVVGRQELGSAGELVGVEGQ